MLNNIGLPGLLLIAVVLLVLFGRGKISSMMGEVGKGITSFKRGMEDGRKEIEDSTLVPPRDVTPAEASTTRQAAALREAAGTSEPHERT